MAVTVAGLAGAEGPQVGLGSAVRGAALLTVLAPVALGTRALLHPAGRRPRAPHRRHQGDLAHVTGT